MKLHNVGAYDEQEIKRAAVEGEYFIVYLKYFENNHNARQKPISDWLLC